MRNWYVRTILLEPCIGSCFTSDSLIPISRPRSSANAVWKGESNEDMFPVPIINDNRNTNVEALPWSQCSFSATWHMADDLRNKETSLLITVTELMKNTTFLLLSKLSRLSPRLYVDVSFWVCYLMTCQVKFQVSSQLTYATVLILREMKGQKGGLYEE